MPAIRRMRGIRISHFFRGLVKGRRIARLPVPFPNLPDACSLSRKKRSMRVISLIFSGVTPCFSASKYREKPAVVAGRQGDPSHCVAVYGGGVQAVQRDVRSAHRLHQCRLKACADCHYLAGGFHLGAELSADSRKLVKRPFGKFDHHIVQRRLEAGAGFARDVVPDFVQRVAERDFCGDLGNRISGRLAGKCRGTRNTRVDLNDRIFKGIRIQGELAVAPADDSEGRDDFQ